jgi:hypothetical protein
MRSKKPETHHAFVSKSGLIRASLLMLSALIACTAPTGNQTSVPAITSPISTPADSTPADSTPAKLKSQATLDRFTSPTDLTTNSWSGGELSLWREPVATSFDADGYLDNLYSTSTNGYAGIALTNAARSGNLEIKIAVRAPKATASAPASIYINAQRTQAFGGQAAYSFYNAASGSTNTPPITSSAVQILTVNVNKNDAATTQLSIGGLDPGEAVFLGNVRARFTTDTATTNLIATPSNLYGTGWSRGPSLLGSTLSVNAIPEGSTVAETTAKTVHRIVGSTPGSYGYWSTPFKTPNNNADLLQTRISFIAYTPVASSTIYANAEVKNSLTPLRSYGLKSFTATSTPRRYYMDVNKNASDPATLVFAGLTLGDLMYIGDLREEPLNLPPIAFASQSPDADSRYGIFREGISFLAPAAQFPASGVGSYSTAATAPAGVTGTVLKFVLPKTHLCKNTLALDPKQYCHMMLNPLKKDPITNQYTTYLQAPAYKKRSIFRNKMYIPTGTDYQDYEINMHMDFHCEECGPNNIQMFFNRGANGPSSAANLRNRLSLQVAYSTSPTVPFGRPDNAGNYPAGTRDPYCYLAPIYPNSNPNPQKVCTSTDYNPAKKLRESNGIFKYDGPFNPAYPASEAVYIGSDSLNTTTVSIQPNEIITISSLQGKWVDVELDQVITADPTLGYVTLTLTYPDGSIKKLGWRGPTIYKYNEDRAGDPAYPAINAFAFGIYAETFPVPGNWELYTTSPEIRIEP